MSIQPDIATTPSMTEAVTEATSAAPWRGLAASVLGMFVVTLDAVIVNVALPHVQGDLGGGMTGLQWIVDGYTLMFAALLLSAGSLSDRFGAGRTLSAGFAVFGLASLACGLAPTSPTLVVARFVQGSAAAVMMPASMALIGHSYPDPGRRARAVALWAMGGAVASSAGPVLGGVLAQVNWRLIFFVNVPVCLAALLLLVRAFGGSRHAVSFDWIGQALAVAAMGSLTYAAIESGTAGLAAPRVWLVTLVAVVSVVAFIIRQATGRHPMLPLSLFRHRAVVVAVVCGFAFMVGYYGLPFVMSLYLQQQRGLTSLGTGLVFLPMMLVGLVLTPLMPRVATRVGARRLIAAGLGVMALGLAAIAVVASVATNLTIGLLMILVGLGGPLVMPALTAVLLHVAHGPSAGIASGVFNTARQVGGALAVAVFGALLQTSANVNGVRASLAIAALVAIAAAATTVLLPRTQGVAP